MARTTITIPTATAIDMLRERITEDALCIAESEKIEAEYQVAQENWTSDVMSKLLTLTPITKRVFTSRYGAPLVNVEVSFNIDDVPTAPERRDNPYRFLNTFDKREIEAQIKLLQAHTEPTIGAGTLNKMSKFL